ncbi:MAG: acyl-CoA/acyl-ACP dehydrogenase [Frankiales bacterium]|nr:acyl-CoA/acyl-ACP dehydrogenase [Frankiales bacterium]
MTPVSPAVQRARALAGELLRPSAEDVDRDVVPRSHLDAWGAAGLLGIGGPAAYGGGGAPAAVVREVSEVLAGASGATWFVATQHAMPLALLAASANEALKDRLLPGLCNGQVLSGVAVAQLRRPGPPAVTATRVDGGWRFDGHVGWMTSWGICDVVLLGGLTTDGQVVLALLPARDGGGLSSSAPLELAAMQATSTVTLDLDGLVASDAEIVEIVETAAWLAADATRTANAGPHHFGLQRECVRRLAETAARRDDGTAAALAHALGAEGERLRAVAYTLLDDVPADEHLEDRLAVRASVLELVMRTATALVAATGGAALAADAAPQRLVREALFQQVQAQTPTTREASLQLLRELGS